MTINFNKIKDYGIVSICILLLTCFMHALTGIYPFGEYAIEFSDLGSSYIPQVLELKNLILEGDFSKLLHSWNRIDGSTPLAMANLGILLNPLTLLYTTLPLSKVSECTVLYITLKYMIAGCAFLWCLRTIFPERQDHKVQIALSIAWGLNMYFVIHHFLIIWTDFMVILPITIGCMHQFLDNPKCRWRLFSCLLYAFIANFYFAFILVVFCFCYLILQLLLKQVALKTGIKVTLHYIGLHVIALLFSVPTLYPSFKILLGAGSYESSLQFGLAQNPILIFTKLFTAYYNDVLLKDSLYIFIGCTSLFLLILMGCSSALAKREKCLVLGFFGLFILSFILNPLYLIWHALDEPNGFPGRMGFCLIFYILLLVYTYYENLEVPTKVQSLLPLVSIVICIILVLSYVHYSTLLHLLGIPASICFYFALVYKPHRRKFIPIVMSIEIVCTSLLSFNTRYADSGLQNIHALKAHRKIIQDEVYALKALEDDKTSFYRTALDSPYVFDLNWGAMYGMKSITGFNNINDDLFAEATNIIHSGRLVGNSILINDTTPFSNFLLGTKYRIATDGTTPIQQLQDTVYLGCVVQEAVTAEDLASTVGACENQNTLIQKMSGLDLPIFEPVKDLTPDDPHQLTFETKQGEVYYSWTYYSNFNHTPTFTLDDKVYDFNRAGLIELNGDGTQKTLKTGEAESLSYQTSTTLPTVKLMVHHLLTHNYQQYLNILCQQVLKVKEFTDTSLTATIDVRKDDSLVYVSLPKSNYRVLEDGKVLKIEEPIPGYLGVRLNAGSHELEIQFNLY